MGKDHNIPVIFSLILGWGFVGLILFVYARVFETEIKSTESMIKIDTILKVDSVKLDEFDFTRFDTIIISPGGSLCGTIGMTEEEALAFAQKFGYPYKYKTSGDLIVNVQPGECFIKGQWQPEVLKHLVKK